MYVGFVLPNSRHHVTATFHGHDETKDQYQSAVLALAKAARDWEGPEIELEFRGEVAKFMPADVWYAPVISPTLAGFRENLTWWLEYYNVAAMDEFAFIPHLTLTKFPKKPKNPYHGFTVAVPRLSVVSNEFGRTDVLI